jgi:hypothetical protein
MGIEPNSFFDRKRSNCKLRNTILAEDDSIELFTGQGNYAFQEHLRSQPQHLPFLNILGIFLLVQ